MVASEAKRKRLFLFVLITDGWLIYGKYTIRTNEKKPRSQLWIPPSVAFLWEKETRHGEIGIHGDTLAITVLHRIYDRYINIVLHSCYMLHLDGRRYMKFKQNQSGRIQKNSKIFAELTLYDMILTPRLYKSVGLSYYWDKIRDGSIPLASRSASLLVRYIVFHQPSV